MFFSAKIIYFNHSTIPLSFLYLCGMRMLFITTLVTCALFIDYHIYNHIFRKTEVFSKKRWLRIFFIGYTLTVDLLIFAFIFLAFRWPFYGPHSISPLPLWLAWFFFLNAVPKCVWFLFQWMGRWSIALALCTAFFLFKGAFYNTRHFEVKHIKVASSKIPPAFNGYKMALFSDVHLGNLSRQERFLRTFVEQLNQLHPDIVFFTGDLINMYAAEITPEVQSILSQIRAYHGVFSVLGNHDMGPYFGKQAEKLGLTPLENTRQVLIRQREMGWQVLQNESVQIVHIDDSIALCGLPYPPLPPYFPDSLTNFNLPLATRRLDAAQFNILLCHTPKVWETMRNDPAFAPVDLTLSGHTHAMQAKIKAGRRQWSPAAWMYDYWSGLYEENGRYLYVNEGLGYVLYPMRIGSKPEITLITLQSRQP